MSAAEDRQELTVNHMLLLVFFLLSFCSQSYGPARRGLRRRR